MFLQHIEGQIRLPAKIRFSFLHPWKEKAIDFLFTPRLF